MIERFLDVKVLQEGAFYVLFSTESHLFVVLKCFLDLKLVYSSRTDAKKLRPRHDELFDKLGSERTA